MENLEEQFEKIFTEVKKRAEAEAAYTLEAWKTIVDDVLESHEEFGEVSEENDQNMKDILIDRYSEFKSSL